LEDTKISPAKEGTTLELQDGAPEEVEEGIGVDDDDDGPPTTELGADTDPSSQSPSFSGSAVPLDTLVELPLPLLLPVLIALQTL
jgi:hypothetical protein